jgi:hypothetical protein
MINQIRYTWQILVLSSIILILGILLIPRLGFELSLNHFIITLISVTAINLLAWFIMVRGTRKSTQDGAVILLAGMGVKFILYLLYILVFWLVTKNLTKPFIITFFALYLVFTFFLAGHLLKLLKNK